LSYFDFGHQTPTMASAKVFDPQLAKCETSLARVEAAQGSMVKLMKTETDMLTNIEALRNILTQAYSSTDGDKDRANLMEVFGGDCGRIARARGMLEAVTLSERNARDQRPAQCLLACEVVEKVLIEKGLREKLLEAQKKNAWSQRRATVEAESTTVASATAICSGFAESTTAATTESTAEKAVVDARAAQQNGYGSTAPPRAEPSLAAPKQTVKVVGVSEAGQFEPDDVPRNVMVELSSKPLDTDIDFGANGTYVMSVPNVIGVLKTTVTPALPIRAGVAPLEPYLEFPCPLPEDSNKVIFDPDKKIPASGRWSITFERRVKVLELPNSIEAKVGCQSLSPWGSQQFKDKRGETELHWDVTIQGKFAMSEGSNATTVLEVDLVFHVQCQLSGAASAMYSDDGQPIAPPARG